MEKTKKSAWKRIANVFLRIGDVILILLVIIALIIVIPNIFGIKTLTVLSGSMNPNIPTGSIVFVVPTDAEDIRVGDAISYVFNEAGEVVTHRVIGISEEDTLYFAVKGDANPNPDANPVMAGNVLGVVRFHIPLLGYALGITLTTNGRIIVGTVIIALILLLTLTGKGRSKKKEDDEEQALNEGKRKLAPAAVTDANAAKAVPPPANAKPEKKKKERKPLFRSGKKATKSMDNIEDFLPPVEEFMRPNENPPRRTQAQIVNIERMPANDEDYFPSVEEFLRGDDAPAAMVIEGNAAPYPSHERERMPRPAPERQQPTMRRPNDVRARTHEQQPPQRRPIADIPHAAPAQPPVQHEMQGKDDASKDGEAKVYTRKSRYVPRH